MPYELVCVSGVDPDIARQLAEVEVARLAGRKIVEKIEVAREGDEYVLTVHAYAPIRRLRRITGYAAEVDRWNEAKKAELRDRVAHIGRRSTLPPVPPTPGADQRVRIHAVTCESVTDGPGLRDVIFFQGCPHRCPGCHNPDTWDWQGGETTTVGELLAVVPSHPLLDGVTISGGEPFAQPQALLALCRGLRARGVRSIWVYTGYTWGQVLALGQRWPGLLELIDVVVDGRYQAAQRDLSIPFRGSRNQRLVDVYASMQSRQVVEWTPQGSHLPPPVRWVDGRPRP